MTSAELIERAAESVLAAFAGYRRRFAAITRRAPRHFEDREWRGIQRDALERLELYEQVISAIQADLAGLLAGAALDAGVWSAMRSAYARRIAGLVDVELAATFFNSITRRVFTTVGVDPRMEFVQTEAESPPSHDRRAAAPRPAQPRDTADGACDPSAASPRSGHGARIESAPPSPRAMPCGDDVDVARPPRPCFDTHAVDRPLSDVVAGILRGCGFTIAFENIERDAQRVAGAIERELSDAAGPPTIAAVDVVRAVFYRNKGAYVVGRIRAGGRVIPLTIALLNVGRGPAVDAVLLTADEVSVVFSFTRSYFLVEVEHPRELITFLQSIMPRKPLAELYNAVGFNKHGKTELYRDLMAHIGRSHDQFQIAEGERGMVMLVFTLPSYDVVFKVIRDRFDYPKTATRAQVMEKYRLVFEHDRAGRMADVQEFEHLEFARERFDDDLLRELAGSAAESVRIDRHTVAIRHLYTERRMTPLNLYLKEAGPRAAREAILDYGQAVRDLAMTNIFPGDMLLKNFGVTRHGRVVFYDYDELCRVTDCQFREMPAARDVDEECAGEPWFYVGPNDIFPEEFIRFLGLDGELLDVFVRAHGELLTAQYWRRLQAQHRAGVIMDIIPYRLERRLTEGPGG